MGGRSIGGLWTDECPQCLGLWAPGDVMDRLVSRVEETHRRQKSSSVGSPRRERHAAWQEQVVYRHCPECGGTMQRKNFGGRSGVVLDWCGSHGTWLDAHEMEDVAAFVMAGGLDHAPDASMPADPARTAAILAAEQLLVQERGRSQDQLRRIDTRRMWRGLGDLFDHLMK
jgi:Zn-finger nucleic acid-binding protein